MLEEKRLKEVESRVKNYIRDGIIKSKEAKKHVNFFLINSEDSLNSARCLFDMSTNQDYQQYTGYEGLKGFLWVINASY